ncbi:MAG: ribosome biogenesis GTPase YlqF [Clostridia bacterium]|nr:ribosome biogenesis GTPase YlqF [Clostridia bacterium]
MANDRINWYPGHMAKSRRLLQDQLRAVDAVIELCDARAPLATRNPDLARLTRDKTRILVLNKADLADDAQTARWLEYFRRQGLTAMRFNSNGGKVKEILGHIEAASKPALERYAARGVRKTIRFMVIGIPNVGKSTFINRLHGSAIVKSGDRPGVTRANQWVKIGPFLEILDTPGMLPPRMDDQEGAKLLACLGSIRDEIMDTEALAGHLMALLYARYPAALRARYKLPEDCGGEPHELIEAACKGRGWLLSGGRYDTDRAAALVLDEFRGGKIGRITLETV